ncbi:hypothetical protein D3C87_2209400 [compost metagenome]
MPSLPGLGPLEAAARQEFANIAAVSARAVADLPDHRMLIENAFRNEFQAFNATGTR